MANWQVMAQAHGWQEVAHDPESTDDVPCLHHEELNRIWPLGDWEGACRDIGLDEEDLAEFAELSAA